MKKMTLIAIAGLLFILSGCSNNNQETKTFAPAVKEPAVVAENPAIIEYDTIAVDNTKLYKIKYFLLSDENEMKNSKFSKGKKISSEQSSGTQTSTKFKIAVNDLTNKILINSEITAPFQVYYSDGGGLSAAEYFLKALNENVPENWHLTINDTIFSFTDNGVRLPKNFVKRFKKSFNI